MTDLVAWGSKLVFDAATGFAVEKALEPVLQPAWSLLKSVLLPRWDPAVEAIRLNLAEAVEKRRAEDKEYDAKLVASLKRGEADALLTHLARAAAQATTDDRMEMLAAAVAGVLTPDLDSETRSRVARAIEQLEPTDAVSLRAVAKIAKGLPIVGVNGGEASRAALVQAGALIVHVGGKSFAQVLEVTSLGLSILKALEHWKPI